jgi:multiple sugar transport system substrate-binding protein
MAKRISRRQFVKGVAVGAALALTGGCAATPGASPVAETPLPAKVSGEIEFAYYNWGPASIQYFKDMAAAFEQSHPGTRIRLTLPPEAEYLTKLQILLATGSGPDIITTTGLTQKLFEQGRLLDLTDRVQADPVLLDPAKFMQGGWDIYRFGTNKIYGIYSGADTHLLYYNKSIFDKAGAKYPTPDWTLNDYLEAARALTIREGDRTVQWGTALSILYAYWGWANLVWMEGGDIVDQRPFYTKLTLNNEPVIKVLTFIQDMIFKYKVAPSPSQAAALGETFGFPSGTVAMVFDGGWSIQSFKTIEAFEWDIEMLPKGSQGFVGAFWPGTPMQISASTKNPELAWEFVRWFAASREAQELIAKQLIQVPALFEVATSDVFLKQPGLPPNAKAWTESLRNARPGDIMHVNNQEMMDKVWNPNWDKFIEGKMSPEEWARTVETEGNKILAG